MSHSRDEGWYLRIGYKGGRIHVHSSKVCVEVRPASSGRRKIRIVGHYSNSQLDYKTISGSTKYNSYVGKCKDINVCKGVLEKFLATVLKHSPSVFEFNMNYLVNTKT